MRWGVLVTLSLTVAWAQPEALTTSEQVVAQLDRAHDQLLLLAPSLFSKPVAEAVRRAAAERGVQVFILVAPAWVEAPGSYVASLALLGGVQVRLAETERRFVVLDRDDAAFVLEGGLVSESQRRFDERPTYALADPQEVQARAGHFTQLWGSATLYRSFIDREDFP